MGGPRTSNEAIMRPEIRGQCKAGRDKAGQGKVSRARQFRQASKQAGKQTGRRAGGQAGTQVGKQASEHEMLVCGLASKCGYVLV